MSQESNSPSSASSGTSGDARDTGNLSGVYTAIVINNEDPEGRYRVEVVVRTLLQDLEPCWAQVVSLMASKEYGAFFLPEVGDEVLVSFLGGEPGRPVVLGSLYPAGPVASRIEVTREDIQLAVPNSDQGGKNDVRFIQSRSKHALVFQDTEGEERISLRSARNAELVFQDKGGEEKVQLYDQNRDQWLEIDVGNKKITLQSDTGEICLTAKTKITLDCEDFVLNATRKVGIEAGTSLDLKATSEAALESDTKVTIKGALISLN
jgi:uncharacterized protein involved in type VI secretion and phage assembly